MNFLGTKDALGTIGQRYFAGSLESSQETSASLENTRSVWFLHLKKKRGDFGMLTSSLLLVEQAKLKATRTKELVMAASGNSILRRNSGQGDES